MTEITGFHSASHRKHRAGIFQDDIPRTTPTIPIPYTFVPVPVLYRFTYSNHIDHRLPSFIIDIELEYSKTTFSNLYSRHMMDVEPLLILPTNVTDFTLPVHLIL